MSKRRSKCNPTLRRKLQAWYAKCTCQTYGQLFHDKNEAREWLDKNHSDK